MAKISLRTIDYFKFKNLVIDRVSEDSDRCTREVQALCEGVARLNSRQESFDPSTDRRRLDEICGYYKLILETSKIISMDVRLKSGWWGSDRNTYSAGKLKASALRETFLQKTRDWMTRHGWLGGMADSDLERRIEGPGIFVFKHRTNACFQLVGRTDHVFGSCSENLKASFEGGIAEPLAALLITSTAQQWDFYFIPLGAEDDDSIQCIVENDTILKHDSIWPYGLNLRLTVNCFLDVDQLRQSCRRHGWPPERKRVHEGELYLNRLRLQVNEACNAFLALDTLHRVGVSSCVNSDLSCNIDISSLPSTPAQFGFIFVDKRNKGREVSEADRMSISSSSSSGSSSSLSSSITATTVRTAIQKKPTESAADSASRDDSASEASAQSSGKSKSDRSSSVGASFRRTSASRSASQLTTTPRKDLGSSVRSRSASNNGSQRSSTSKRLAVESSTNHLNGSTSGSNSPMSSSSSPVGSGTSSSGLQQQWRLSWECPRSSKSSKK